MIKHFEPNVIIVDDVKDEVKGIYDFFVEKGIGCKIYNPDFAEGDVMPEKPYTDISLIFLDLYYSNSPFDAEQSCNWVRSLVPEKSFYILVFWTRDQSKAIEILDLLNKKNRTPFLYFIESKQSYNPDGEFEFSKLISKIQSDCESSPSIQEILTWKKTIKKSTNEVLGHLAKQPSDITIKLKKVILAHGGKQIKDKNDFLKRNVLFDALDIVLISNTKKNVSDEISDKDKTELYDLSTKINLDPDNELNSWFHFKLIKTEDIDKGEISAGLISLNKHSFFKKLYSIKDDPKLENKLKKQIEKEETKIDDIVMVLNRPCDIAQGKYGKNIKLLSGLKISNPKRYEESDSSDAKKVDKRKIGKLHFNDEELPDSTRFYDYLYFSQEDSDVVLIFDFRYVFSVPEKIFIEKFDNIKLFNKELLSEIQVEYSSYSSRLGITQII